VLAAGMAVLAACGSGSTASPPAHVNSGSTTANLASDVHFANGTASQYGAPANTGDYASGLSSNPAAMDWTQLSAGAAGALNPVVLNGDGFTLYRFDKDTANPSASNCNGSCATTWPPVLVQPGARVYLDGVAQSKVGLVKRADGTLQVTIGGWPVYRYSGDTAAGQTNGQGVGGTWFGVTPDGTKASASPQGTNSTTGLDYETGTATQHNAPPNTGDFFTGPRTAPPAMLWVQLTAGSANGLSPIVHDAAGFTLYRFDKDTPHPSASNCTGACATTWPPVLVHTGSRIFVDGVPTAEVGIITRPDGTRQVTLGGWPLYRYSGDTAAGQTNGENVGGTWFAISPTGGKITPPASQSSPTPATSGYGAPSGASSPASTPAAGPTSNPGSSTVTLKNGTVILDTGTNFTEPNGSEGVAGPGCQNLSQPNTASSLQLAGGPIKIWTGSNCTGTSAVVTDSVADLSTIGFDKKITSIRFGD
jgi:predicted lipoprotein with Yx(FWY)xxD motif